MTSASRIGILGGTFDPIHVGHLDAALAAQEALMLDEVVIVPSHLTPHKSSTSQVSGHHRFTMSELATADMPNIRVSNIELKTSSSSPSYTSLTLQQFSESGYSSQQLFFIIGSDAFSEIEQWHNYPSLLEQSHFVVISRSGLSGAALREQLPSLSGRMRTITASDHDTASNQKIESTLVWLVETKTRNVSSSDIRKLLSRNESTEGLLPRAVKSYISKHHLYPDTSQTNV
ncbi:MAG: nicotinate-nucleotide adenylyltransferase [Acidobacteriota bacterium]|nr:nicotinate-nucleotide adenylyltransferase [Acidobacteriota bacterium]